LRGDSCQFPFYIDLPPLLPKRDPNINPIAADKSFSKLSTKDPKVPADLSDAFAKAITERPRHTSISAASDRLSIARATSSPGAISRVVSGSAVWCGLVSP
jgi:hypothetical protein